jgi:hypothetical protein
MTARNNSILLVLLVTVTAMGLWALFCRLIERHPRLRELRWWALSLVMATEWLVLVAVQVTR